MEIGLTKEEGLAIYLRMDMKDESDMMIVSILQQILDDKSLSTEEKQSLLRYIRNTQIKA